MFKMNRIHGWTGFHIWLFDLSIPPKVLRNSTVLPPLETPRLGPDEQATTCYHHLRVPKLITSLISGTNHSVSNLWFLNAPKTSINTIDKGNNSWTVCRHRKTSTMVVDQYPWVLRSGRQPDQLQHLAWPPWMEKIWPFEWESFTFFL